MSEEKEIFDKKFVHCMWDDVLEGKRCIVSDSIDTMIDAVDNGTYHTAVINRSKGGGYALHSNETGVDYTVAYYDPNYECKVAYAQGKAIQCRNKGDDNWIVTSNPNWVDRCEYRVKPEQEMWTACIDDEGVISVMPACEWNKDAGRELINGTRNECKDYAIGRYCMNCIHRVSSCCVPTLACQGFRELKEVKKRRWTNRELAKWVWQGNGQVKYRDGYYTLIACTAYDIRDDNKPCPDYYVIRGWDETEWSEPLIEE